MEDHVYLVIDLKSFYASVECVERGLDAMTTNLVVADPTRGKGTLCLAVSPSMKALGVKNRCRVYEIRENIKYITAPPRMQLYIDYSAEIYGIYLKYFSKDDIHVYSIDEAFMDATHYLSLYQMDVKDLGIRIMQDIKNTTGITATCGIGSNMYLAKIALDITAKHVDDHIGILDEELYRKSLWDYQPLTDYWMIGRGTVNRLSSVGLLTMRDVAHADEKLLYRLFGINAEYLIDHAWGREPTTIADIKGYKVSHHSLSNGQVLLRDYNYEDALLIVKEMSDIISLDMVDKGLVTNSVSLYVGYSSEMMKPARGSATMTLTTNSSRILMSHFVNIYERITNRLLPIRRICLTCNDVLDEAYEQYDLFSNPADLMRDRMLQLAILEIKQRYGKNAIFRGMDLLSAGTTLQRNRQIGGHADGYEKS